MANQLDLQGKRALITHADAFMGQRVAAGECRPEARIAPDALEVDTVTS
jgi:hypothetical protein